jgi:hypothetical protein
MWCFLDGRSSSAAVAFVATGSESTRTPAMVELGAVYRDDGPRLPPTRSHLEAPAHKLLETRHGPLDLLGTIEHDTRFEDLLAEAEWIDLGGIQVRVLSLTRLIRVGEPGLTEGSNHAGSAACHAGRATTSEESVTRCTGGRAAGSR